MEEQEKLRKTLGDRPAEDHDQDLEYDPWPPRAWRFRAPNGFRTVNLIGGPANSQEYRVAVGDDAFVHIGYRKAFGDSFACWGRYSPKIPGDVNYHFTGEYYLR